MTARQLWKAWYRQQRITRRETAKALSDAYLCGTGFVMISGEPDFIRHIDIRDVWL